MKDSEDDLAIRDWLRRRPVCAGCTKFTSFSNSQSRRGNDGARAALSILDKTCIPPPFASDCRDCPFCDSKQRKSVMGKRFKGGGR